jgi:hypothetical protein
MGCWNETCGISNLPIHYDNKVRLFVLEQTHNTRHIGGGTCYINESWAPIGPPIAGLYNDYGGIEKIKKSPSNKILLNIIKEKILPFDVNELDGFINGKVMPIKDMDLENLILAIERELGQTKNVFGETVSLGIMFVLEEVYQALLTYNPIETQSIKQGHFVYKPYKDILMADLERWYKGKFDRFQELKRLAKNSKDDALAGFRADFYLDSDDGSVLFWDIRDHDTRLIKNQIQECIRKEVTWEDDKAKVLIKILMETLQIKNAMTAARKFWSPQTGKGGQHGELDIYKLLNKTSTSIIEHREKESIADGGEIADDNGYYPYMLEHNEEELKNDS